MELEKIIAEMREQGADDEQILKSLEQMAQEGKITPEDFEKAKEVLMANKEADAEEEKAKAEELFGMKLI